VGARVTLADEELAALAAEALFVRDAFVAEADARAARAELETHAAGVLRPARMGRGGAHERAGVRDDAIAWVHDLPGFPAETPALAALAARFDALGEALRREAMVPVRSHELQVARYAGDGARYARHLDAFRDRAATAPARRVTAIVYLNPDWVPAHGGALRVFLPAGPRDVEPRAGRLVVFLSDRVEHEVLPAYAPRWAVTAWYIP
jgi:SM-20-related protein